MPDGSSRYVGKCSTHEDYFNFYYKKQKTIQKYTDLSDLSSTQVDTLIAKIGSDLLELAIKSSSNDIYPKLKENIANLDDVTVETIKHSVFPKLKLTRVNLGYGGGNGGYVILNKNTDNKYEVISVTGDGDLNFCDKKVWLGSK